jgi:hypothetical protein
LRGTTRKVSKPKKLGHWTSGDADLALIHFVVTREG